jgi:hypothetical protein
MRAAVAAIENSFLMVILHHVVGFRCGARCPISALLQREGRLVPVCIVPMVRRLDFRIVCIALPLAPSKLCARRRSAVRPGAVQRGRQMFISA